MNKQQQVGRAFRHHFEGPFWRRVFLGGIRNLPQSIQRASMPMWAGIFYTLVPAARRIAEQNLARIDGALPPAQAKLRSFRLFVNYSQAITNMYALHLGQTVPVEAEFVGRDNLTQVLDQGRGAIIVTGHMGAWQIAQLLMQGKGMPPLTMAMAAEPNQHLADYEQQFRAKQRIVYTTSSPFATLELANVLRRGELVGMQLDRHLGGPHVQVPFFGLPAPFPLGPATLARASGAPLVPIFIMAEKDRRRCKFFVEKPIEVARTRDRAADYLDATRRVVEVYQRYVRRYPEQWFNFYDFWNPPPPKEARAA
jgi:KDO2-lipid IV(A) lauroyltransferase